MEEEAARSRRMESWRNERVPEAADPSVSIDLMVRSLLRMGASRKDVASYIATPGRKRAA
jgi:hypothetical protein